MFRHYERDHWHKGMTALLERKTPLSIILSLYQSICVSTAKKRQKSENHKKHGSSLRSRLCPKPAPPAYYSSQLAAMPMVANHLHYVVLSLGGTVELCMLSLCTRFEECSNCLRAIWYTRILPTPYYVVVSLDLERFHIIYYMRCTVIII